MEKARLQVTAPPGKSGEERRMVHDADLQIQACHFRRVLQTFPNHFHDYYLVGLTERGGRMMVCRGREYALHSGDIQLFNPGDPHTCIQVEGDGLTFRSFCIPPEVMAELARMLTGTAGLPQFRQPLLRHAELASCLREAHRMVMAQGPSLQKEERFFFFMGSLLTECADMGGAAEASASAPTAYGVTVPAAGSRVAIEEARAYLERHYADGVTLEELCALTGLSKYYLLRSFTRQLGIAPYAYLETIRLAKARDFLERGQSPAETAGRCGFCDQSHFSNFFKRYMGITPAQYQRIFIDARKDMPC